MFDTQRNEVLLEALERHGFRSGFPNMADFGRDARFVTLVHISGVVLDLALGCMPFEDELIERSTEYPDPEITARLPTPKDLIILKAIANRPQDQIDIRTIAEIRSNLDTKRIERWVREYGELLETPHLWDEISKLLATST